MSEETNVPTVWTLVRDGDPDKKPLLYACPKCGLAHSPKTYFATHEAAHAAARHAAEDCYACKTHDICSVCGCETHKGWAKCNSCAYDARLAKAVEVPDDGGPYCRFDGDDYFGEMDEAIDSGAEWVSPCHVSYPRIDPDNVIDNLLSDMHEDAQIDDLVGVDALYEAIKIFNEAQTMQTWVGDSTRKIRVIRDNEKEMTDV